jgi:hypothetical protein
LLARNRSTMTLYSSALALTLSATATHGWIESVSDESASSMIPIKGIRKFTQKAAIAMSKNSNAAFDWTAYCLLIARVVPGISIVSDQHKFRFLIFIQVRFS